MLDIKTFYTTVIRRIHSAFRFIPKYGKSIETEPVLRSALFNVEQMERHGRELAESHKCAEHRITDRLLDRLDENERILRECCQMFTAVTALSKFDRRITPAGEWMLDNYYMIDEQIRIVRRHLPKSYSRELPQLVGCTHAGMPRVYDIALENISHGDGRLDMDTLRRFVAAYQSVTPLTLGELWAVPIMLRLAVVENLRRVAVRVGAAWQDHMSAARWAERMLETASKDRKSPIVTVAEMAVSEPSLTSAFVAEFARRLQGQAAPLNLPLAWLEENLAESGQTVSELIQLETRQQAADQVAVSNSMASLRLISMVDWKDFVESLSVVEAVLRKDPSGIYSRMDFASRDRCRHAVERLSKTLKIPEAAVAESALELAREAASRSPGNERSERGVATHVGWYLLDRGLQALERRAAKQAGVSGVKRLYMKAAHFIRAAALPLYLGSVLFVTLALARPFIASLQRSGLHGWDIVCIAVAAVLAASEPALRLVNRLVTYFVRPGFIPRLDYSTGIPAEARTMVVIPTLIGSQDEVADVLEKLEMHYLGNRDPNLRFGLLTDFRDAPEATLPDDEPLLATAIRGVENLNRRYAESWGEPFFLCHRPRCRNNAENVWMGHERKRGKLCDFSDLLRGVGRERFMVLTGDAVNRELQEGRRTAYVITLDADTRLPHGAARELVGAMAHPLNRPVRDPHRKRIDVGYGILQPRMGITLPSAEQSAYARLFCCEAGVDPYTRTVSDVYQDLFGEGSYIGKGIYDVDALKQTVQGRFPDNRILSHDLIEGCCARSGLLSNVLLYESFPSNYSADVSRRRRWIRGDWQLVPWLLPRVPLAEGGCGRNPFSALARWKMFDNLRRSLSPVALFILLFTGWIACTSPAAWSLGIALLCFGLPLFDAVSSVVRRPAELPFVLHFKAVLRTLYRHILREALTLAWLPHEVWYTLDAILRTLWRMLISRRGLLRWSSSREAELCCARTLSAFFRLMWVCPVAAVAGFAVLFPDTHALFAALPFLASWAAAPLPAWNVSLPSRHEDFVPTEEQHRFLRALARKTWAFFEHHMDAEDNRLPPDNMQERPTRVVAHRTSPTNMGLGLLAHLAAADFGYLSTGKLLERLDATVRSMAGLERYRNHFYNWYDTRTGLPLAPRYISTVDSGNLAGHLLTLRAGLEALADVPVFHVRLFEGLADTGRILGGALLAEGFDCRALLNFQTELEAVLRREHASVESAAQSAARLLELAVETERCCRPLTDSESAFWIEALTAQCRDIHDDLKRFALPWATARCSLRELARLDAAALPEEERPRAVEVRHVARERLEAVKNLTVRLDELARMDFGFLYDSDRNLLAVGFNLDTGRPDAAFYDLLASEARLAYYVGVAFGQLPQKSWFAPGRLQTSVDGIPVLLSWSGSMFEYLMPLLVMPHYEGSLLERTCKGVVRRQIEYGLSVAPAWGISESCYNMPDAQLNYQYRDFGVPGLGLKPGLGENLVLAPYASALALMIAPGEACANLQHLVALGAAGRYGMYEAVDYTPSRLPRGHTSAVIRAFMSHHQGMTLLALDNLFMDNIMQRRFMAVPEFRACELLLQERVPAIAAEHDVASADTVMNTAEASARAAESALRVFRNPDDPHPAVQLLSNGRYHVMVSSAGGGYSRLGDTAVTRWSEDPTRDNRGWFFYLRDVESGVFWSAACRPATRRPEFFEAVFSDARAEFRVREQDFESHTEIVVSPEDDVELRRVRLTNRGRRRRTVEFTSYAEVVLAPAEADARHPAFSNLFVETESLPELQAVICTRRPRSAEEVQLWLCGLLAVHDADVEAVSYETDRERFIGRGRTLANPVVMDSDPDGPETLSGTFGAVLDPVVAIRCRISLDPGRTAVLDAAIGVGESRDECLRQIEKFRDRRLSDRVFDLAWTHSQVLLHQLNASLRDAGLYQDLASYVLYADAALRADPSIQEANTLNQTGLWGQGISGDLPVVLVKIGDDANIELAAQLVKAHTYWHHKGLRADLVIWNEERGGYRQQLQDRILALLPSPAEAHVQERPGGIFVRSGQRLSREDRLLLQSVARVVLDDVNGPPADQVYRRRAEPLLPPETTYRPTQEQEIVEATLSVPRNLYMDNAYGGFSADTGEYVVVLHEGRTVPAPWVNVLANPGFGSVVSESGSAYTWQENAHEFRLTPWENDPVTDASGEALYLRDEDNGRFWSPTALPARGKGIYIARHGFGYSVFEHLEQGIYSELRVFVHPDLPVKFSVLRVGNRSGRRRRLSATGYVEWVLGDLRAGTAVHVIAQPASSEGVLLARNPYSPDFAGRTAFFALGTEHRTFTCDRREFLGRNGEPSSPAALRRAALSGRRGPGSDPCAALQTAFCLEPGEERELVFVLGATQGTDAAVELARRCRTGSTAADAWIAIKALWADILGTIQVETPDPAVDVLVNGRLMYQTIASRFWGRSGFYQSGGAFGFRDQLQDAMSLVHALPGAVRAHLLYCAGRQFPEGDVLHWWHPPLDRGVRTRCSDDYLWLPSAVSRYVRITGDIGILDEEVPYIESRKPGLHEEAAYDLPVRSELRETLYRHCIRALEYGETAGVHDLPLIGGGDWNDGMNRVGDKGRGESVWLGFFQHAVLQEFGRTALLYGDEAFARTCEARAARLRRALDRHGWDGSWFRRAYFDDGTPLGSVSNSECRIDALVQSWAVLSGAASPERCAAGMAALEKYLVLPEAGLIRLLNPPFDDSELEPGYIKGYVPGVRENGGQYTHAAVWAIMAFAALGQGEKAWELLRLINPVRHGSESADVYRVEPYAVAADVYAAATHVGRGGWTWYTGAASWMYRLIVESLFGLHVENGRLTLRPVLPAGWPGFVLVYRYGKTKYRIEVERSGAQSSEVIVDGIRQEDETVMLHDDGVLHEVKIHWPGGQGNAERFPLG